MAVDEEEVKPEEIVNSLHRNPPPSWEDWKLASLSRAGGAEEVRAELSFKEDKQDEVSLKPRSRIHTEQEVKAV